MRTWSNSLKSILPAALLLAWVCIYTTGCEDDDDGSDHRPPAGMGSIIVDNNTVDDIEVYIEGIRQHDTGDHDTGAYDRDPGLYRVVLQQDDGDRSWRSDVDVLADRLTILDVAFISGDFDRYSVIVRFD